MLVPVQMLKLCARLFNYLIWGPWTVGQAVRVVVEPWGLGFLVVLTLTVTLTKTLITTQTLNDHN